jgi:hypothetical protein
MVTNPGTQEGNQPKPTRGLYASTTDYSRMHGQAETIEPLQTETVIKEEQQHHEESTRSNNNNTRSLYAPHHTQILLLDI